MNIVAQDIFVPGSLPDSTYISRKTVLCEKVVGMDLLVEMSGSDFINKDIWTQIGIKAGMPYEGATVTGVQSTTTSSEYDKLSKENVIDHYKENGFVL